MKSRSPVQNGVCTERSNSIHLYRVLEDEYINLYGPLPPGYPWVFLQSQIKDAASLLEKIQKADTELTSYLKNQLDDFLKTRGGEVDAYTRNDNELVILLVEFFNERLNSTNLYTKERFAGVNLNEDTRNFVATYFAENAKVKPSDTLIFRINRLLLEDAFSDELECRNLNDVDRAQRFYVSAIYSAIHKTDRTALCLSGGGIRSATFNLGVLQGLARHSLLDKFDYLSTVSGGGYIGSWLTSWIHREPGGLENVVKQLSHKPTAPLQPEPQPIQHLRNYSNYLSPKLGLLSSDTWTLAAIISRNLLLNWLVFIPLLTAVIMVPRLYVSALTQDKRAGWVPILVFVAIVAKVITVSYTAFSLPSGGRPTHTAKEFWMGGLAPLVVSVLLLTLAWAWINWTPALQAQPIYLKRSYFLTTSIVIGFWGWLVYVVRLFRRRRLPARRPKWLTALITLGTAVIVIAVSAFIGNIIWWLTTWRLFPFLHPHLFACLAVPLLLLLYALGGTLIAGLTSRWTEEVDQEWWARCGAWILIFAFAWAAVTVLVFYGPHIPATLHWPQRWSDWESGATAAATAVGILSGIVTLIGGFAPATSAHRSETSTGASEVKAPKFRFEKVISVAAATFLAFIIVLLSLGTNRLLISVASFVTRLNTVGDQGLKNLAAWFPNIHFESASTSLAKAAADFQLRYETNYWLHHLDVIRNTPFRLVLTAWILLIVVGWIMARMINTNIFSVHSMYGNRLKRAYLGASRARRRPHMFTGFDATDNLQMHELRSELFDCNSFSDFESFVRALNRPDQEDLFSIDMRKKLSPQTIQLLDDHIDGQDPDDALTEALIEDLNRLLYTDSLYDHQRFPKQNLSDETKKLLARPPLGESLVLLNRWLLEDAYPSAIKRRKPPRLLHVINIALNLVQGDKLAWQERKAETFTVSPLHSGNLWLGYRRSRYYGGDEGISLGTAFTISGAAASPNMGYMISSPLVSFLMAMFNIRLGWWLGNPGPAGKDTYTRSEPKFTFGPIIQEALSLTDDCSKYVYLSDGGHFENLGLYEMVLRRCKYIVVSDASTDPKYTYDSLGMAIRKIRIDLGIPIEIEDFGIRSGDEGNPYFAIGTIRYSCVDDDGVDGKLIYIKASVSTKEPRDITNYWNGHESFPQEVITDQFFSEPQFESYRMLGSHIIDRMCEGSSGETNWQAENLAAFFDRQAASVADKPTSDIHPPAKQNGNDTSTTVIDESLIESLTYVRRVRGTHHPPGT
jgi:hypothetical protein